MGNAQRGPTSEFTQGFEFLVFNGHEQTERFWDATPWRCTLNPTRIAPEMEAAFPALASPLEVKRLDLGDPPPTVKPREFLVPTHLVDPRSHMNSAAYLDLFEDALVSMRADTQERPATYELEYLAVTLLGDLLHRFIWPELSGWAMFVATPSGLPMVKGRRRRRGLQSDRLAGTFKSEPCPTLRLEQM